MGEHGFRRHATVDRLRRCRRLHHRALAATATIARSHHPLDSVLHRHNVEHFLDGLADLVKRPATAWADLALDVDYNINARQMDRQHAAIAVATRPRRIVGCSGFRIVPGCIRGRVLIRHAGDNRLFISGQQELQLIGVHLLRSAAEQCTLILRQNKQKLLVLLQCGVALGDGALIGERELFRPDLLDDRRRLDEFLLEKQRIGRQIIEATHAQLATKKHRESPAQLGLLSSAHRSIHNAWSHLFPVQAVEKDRQLRSTQRNHAVLDRRPNEAARLKSLRIQN
jgi:hypothetical protein